MPTLRTTKQEKMLNLSAEEHDEEIPLRVVYPRLKADGVANSVAAFPFVVMGGSLGVIESGESLFVEQTPTKRSVLVPARHLAYAAGYRRNEAMVRSLQSCVESHGVKMEPIRHFITIKNPPVELAIEESKRQSIRRVVLLTPEGVELAFKYARLLRKYREVLRPWVEEQTRLLVDPNTEVILDPRLLGSDNAPQLSPADVQENAQERGAEQVAALLSTPRKREEDDAPSLDDLLAQAQAMDKPAELKGTLPLPVYATPEDAPKDEDRRRAVRDLDQGLQVLTPSPKVDARAAVEEVSKPPRQSNGGVQAPQGTSFAAMGELFAQMSTAVQQIGAMQTRLDAAEREKQEYAQMRAEWEEVKQTLREFGQKLITVTTPAAPQVPVRREVERLVRQQAMRARDQASMRLNRVVSSGESTDIFKETWRRLDSEFYRRTGVRLKQRVLEARNRGEKVNRLDIAERMEMLDTLHSVARDLFAR